MKKNNDYINAGLKDAELLDVKIKCFVCGDRDASYRVGVFPDTEDNSLCFKVCVCTNCANHTPQELLQKFCGGGVAA